eukprot:TRINITY_DN9370_c0_g1_i2.p1 TRINITY_DN9370_c0_g1~~TRINITY_DN9370_c0_g1_i2.p1  ORF type:complete len:171 (-),score=53.32 TRINITY_DN9370_c0_g1_i2:6-518(-)
MSDQSLGYKEVINVRWANEDPNTVGSRPQTEDEKLLEQAVIAKYGAPKYDTESIASGQIAYPNNDEQYSAQQLSNQVVPAGGEDEKKKMEDMQAQWAQYYQQMQQHGQQGQQGQTGGYDWNTYYQYYYAYYAQMQQHMVQQQQLQSQSTTTTTGGEVTEPKQKKSKVGEQ